MFVDSACQSWLQQKTIAILITILASGSVVVINVVLALLMRMLTKFEQHHSLDHEALSLSRRLFLSQFTNTAVVVLLANASFTFIKGAAGTRFSDFSSDWLVDVSG